MEAGGQLQVVIGNAVGDVYDAILATSSIKAGYMDRDDKKSSDKNIINLFMSKVSGIFAPILGAMSGAGLLKGLLILLTTMGWLSKDMGTYRILFAAADGGFTFLPDIVKNIFTPLLSLVIIVPSTFLVIGPVSDFAGKLLAGGYTALVSVNPVIAGFISIVINNISQYGRDTLFRCATWLSIKDFSWHWWYCGLIMFRELGEADW